MDYRTLGRTGCAVSSMALGTMTFGTETGEAEAHRQLDQFLAAGGTLVDTADVYSAGVSEEIIGRWLAARPADVTGWCWPPRAGSAPPAAAGLHLTGEETAALDSASGPHAADYPYGELGVDQRSRQLAGG